MRIGMMTDVYKPHVSGVITYIELNKKYLEKAGHEVFVFTFGDLDYKDEEERVIRSPGLPLTDSGYFVSFRYSRNAKALLQTMDLVHVHQPFVSGRLALRYCRPLGIPVVFTNHTRYDLYAQAYLPLLPEELSGTFLQTYIPTFCRSVDLVVSPSRGMAEVLKRLGVESAIEIIPNGVDLELYRNTSNASREDLGFQPEDILLIYSGRLGPEKNLDFLIGAFAGTSEAISNAHLLIVGGGPEEGALKQLAGKTSASGRIHFVGMLLHAEVSRYLAVGDLFVTASVSEVHPLSVIEAMASGLPVLGVRSVGVGDIVEDGVSGTLSSHDQAAFAALMTKLCLEPNLRHSMGLAARSVSDQFDILCTSRIMAERYKELVSGSTERRHALQAHRRRQKVVERK